MNEIPQRSSLVSQVVKILRRELQRGEWVDCLPGELTLCDRLKVSRTTLRAALRILRREGRIVVSQGRRMRIACRSSIRTAPKGTNVVGFLSVLPVHKLSSFSHFLINALQEYLRDAGCQLEVHAHQRFGSSNPSRSLTALMANTRAECWLLMASTMCMQWFAARRIRCLLVGSCGASLAFPSIDVNSHAILRHAVGILRGRGHSRIALMVTDVNLPGQVSIEEDFRRGFARAPDAARIRPIVVRTPDKVADIQASLDSLFAAPRRPTGLLVARPKHVLTVMSHLADSGIRVPRDVAVICLGYEPFLDNLTPSVAHYTFNWKSFAKRLSAMARQLADTGNLPHRENLVMPRFKDGGTLGPGGAR
ncbi:MAG: substrate-binding domain-containing protein [Verrucomicrobia bacterium]|nr:substrate-binding domain-containing protein [Verrucomicrobiota bacterium]